MIRIICRLKFIKKICSLICLSCVPRLWNPRNATRNNFVQLNDWLEYWIFENDRFKLRRKQ